MKKRNCILFLLSTVFLFLACQDKQRQESQKLAHSILNDARLDTVYQRAKNLVKSGFNAGTIYEEVWIRDYNTFIEVSCDELPLKQVKHNLLVFCKFQGDNGNIIDGFIPKEKVGHVPYEYIYTDKAPQYAGHKNTVETDQESSLVQAVHKYIQKTGDKAILKENIFGKSVLERLDFAMEFLMNHRFDPTYQLLWGATTADWGDVQPEHEWGVVLDENSHLCLDIYDNAMFLIAMKDLIQMAGKDSEMGGKWTKVHGRIKDNVRKHLWDPEHQKFIPHVYLKDSPFPADFDENKLHYHGGTAIAIEAGLLSREEIAAVNAQMVKNVQESGALSIGLTVYPVYPQGFFKNPDMRPYGYQNGGDWTWFGARMIQQLVENGLAQEAYDEIQPMIIRVIEHNGFYEWYTVDGKPNGAGKFRGSAGVMAKAIESLKEWARENK